MTKLGCELRNPRLRWFADNWCWLLSSANNARETFRKEWNHAIFSWSYLTRTWTPKTRSIGQGIWPSQSQNNLRVPVWPVHLISPEVMRGGVALFCSSNLCLFFFSLGVSRMSSCYPALNTADQSSSCCSSDFVWWMWKQSQKTTNSFQVILWKPKKLGCLSRRKLFLRKAKCSLQTHAAEVKVSSSSIDSSTTALLYENHHLQKRLFPQEFRYQQQTFYPSRRVCSKHTELSKK